MTIQNLDSYVNSLWDWGFLDNCFHGTRIRVSDLDGIVERNGQFLVIEAKGVKKPIPQGQAIMFSRLTNNGFTVLVIWGTPNQPEQLQVWYPGRDKPGPMQPARVDDIQNIVRRWFDWANNKGRAS